jgi:hypothetical protein
MSWIIPKDECTLTDMKNFREAAMAAGIKRCAVKLGQKPNELTTLQLSNVIDIGTANEQWNTQALAALNLPYSVFQAAGVPAGSITLANNRLIVFYGISIETAPCPVSRLVIRSGGIAGNIIADYDLEQIVNSDTLEGYFDQPVCIDPTQTFAVMVICRIATGAFARIQLKNWLIIPAGQRTA